MSTISPVLSVIENDLKAHAEQSLLKAVNGVLSTLADGTKGLVAYHAAIMQAQYIVQGAIRWIATNPDTSTPPKTFMPAVENPSPVSNEAPANEIVTIHADGSEPVVNQ